MNRLLLLLISSLTILNSCQRHSPASQSAIQPPLYFQDFRFLDSIRHTGHTIFWNNKDLSLDSNFRFNAAERTDYMAKDTFTAEILRIDTLKERNIIAVLISLRPVLWDCHPCGSLLQTYFFEASGGSLPHFVYSRHLDVLGSFGSPPDVSLVKIGDNKYAYQIEPSFTNSGETMSYLCLYELGENNTIRKVFELNPAFDDNSGMCSDTEPLMMKCYSYETKLSFGEWESSYHQLIARKKGTDNVHDKIINIDSTFYYAYRDKGYELIKVNVNEKNTNSK